MNLNGGAVHMYQKSIYIYIYVCVCVYILYIYIYPCVYKLPWLTQSNVL